MKRLLFFSSLLLACSLATAQEIRVAFGTEMREVVEALAREYANQTGGKFVLVPANLDDIVKQLKSEAACDVWLTKELGQLNNLYLTGQVPEKPRVFAKSNMVQVAGKGPGPTQSNDLQNLTRSEVKKIVVMAPAGSAHGKETMRMLHNAGIYDQVKGKLLYATNQSEMQYYLNTRAAEVGISPAPQAKAQRGSQWQEINQKLYRPTEYGVACFKKNTVAPTTAAQDFARFLFSAKAKLILRNHGYEPI